MPVDVAAIRAALAEAASGPWFLPRDGGVRSPNGWITADAIHADAELIVLLRNNAEALLNYIDELEKTVMWLGELKDHYRDGQHAC